MVLLNKLDTPTMTGFPQQFYHSSQLFSLEKDSSSIVPVVPRETFRLVS